jgi:hypothetical protein
MSVPMPGFHVHVHDHFPVHVSVHVQSMSVSMSVTVTVTVSMPYTCRVYFQFLMFIEICTSMFMCMRHGQHSTGMSM